MKRQTTYFAQLAHNYDTAFYNEDYSYYLIDGIATEKQMTHFAHLCGNHRIIHVLRHYIALFWLFFLFLLIFFVLFQFYCFFSVFNNFLVVLLKK